MNNQVIKYGALFIMLYFIATAPTEASATAQGFGTAAVTFLERIGQFLTGLLEGTS